MKLLFGPSVDASEIRAGTCLHIQARTGTGSEPGAGLNRDVTWVPQGGCAQCSPAQRSGSSSAKGQPGDRCTCHRGRRPASENAQSQPVSGLARAETGPVPAASLASSSREIQPSLAIFPFRIES